jgi:hypothetical protein
VQRTIIAVTIPFADIQAVVALPANTRRLRISTLTNTGLRFSFIPGNVEINLGYSVSPGEPRDSGYLESTPVYLYLASAVPGNVAQIEIYQGPARRIPLDVEPSAPSTGSSI